MILCILIDYRYFKNRNMLRCEAIAILEGLKAVEHKKIQHIGLETNTQIFLGHLLGKERIFSTMEHLKHAISHIACLT